MRGEAPLFFERDNLKENDEKAKAPLSLAYLLVPRFSSSFSSIPFYELLIFPILLFWIIGNLHVRCPYRERENVK